jgi:hypothetical protein
MVSRVNFTICKWSVQFRCCALWNRPTVKGDFRCILMPGKALDWRHHQNWVYGQLLPLKSPYFSSARDLGLTTSHEPLYWEAGPRAFALHELSQIRGRSLCFKQRPPQKKRGKGRPWEAAFPILLRQKWSDQSRRWSILSAAYSSDILEPVMKQSQQWRPLGT